ncbi:MAG: bacteriohemerythrin, partial [Proteobacteria bacterium]|nr:bacteriohemerythrin [Pseudomonadota bacterium]
MIEWTPSLSTGVALLDDQHKAIFQLLAEVESAALEERTLFGAYVITRLKHHVQEHFSAEEALMKAAHYPDLVEHAAEHAEFSVKLRNLQLKSIGEDISRDAVELLTDWLTDHISVADMA